MIKIWYHREPGNVDDYREFESIFDIKFWKELCSDLGDEITIVKGEADGKEYTGEMVEASITKALEIISSDDFWKDAHHFQVVLKED